jgi:hypothetical protein
MQRRAIALALLLWYVPACTTWQVAQGITPQQLIADRHPAAVRVTLPDSSQIVLDEPSIAGDSVAGFVHGRDSSVVASDVKQVAIRKVSGGRTMGMVVGLGLLGALIAGAVALQSMCILDC